MTHSTDLTMEVTGYSEANIVVYSQMQLAV